MKDKKIVCVEWDDASFNSGYYDKDNKGQHNPIIVKSVGHLVKKNKSVIIIATDSHQYASGEERDERHISTIPKKMIRKITYLKGE